MLYGAEKDKHVARELLRPKSNLAHKYKEERVAQHRTHRRAVRQRLHLATFEREHPEVLPAFPKVDDWLLMEDVWWHPRGARDGWVREYTKDLAPDAKVAELFKLFPDGRGGHWARHEFVHELGPHQRFWYLQTELRR